jgi:hypothetical protein
LEDLSLHILDVAENALRAEATRIRIAIEEDLKEDLMVLEIEDNGKGMAPDMARRVMDPFVTTRTERRVGLGLPLLGDAARMADGDIEIASQPGRGTQLRATFRHGHIDRKPLGDMSSTLVSLLLADAGVDLIYEHTKDGKAFQLNTDALRQELDPVPLDRPEVIDWIREHVRQGLLDIGAVEN